MIQKAAKALDDREHLRMKENCNIFWHVKGKDFKGKAKICNLSAGGMMMETESELFQPDQLDLNFQPVDQKTNFIPQSGHLVWQKKKSFPQNRIQCGVVFDESNADVVTNLRERIQNTISYLTKKRKYKALFNISIAILLVGLIIYSAFISIHVYKNMNNSQQTMDSSVRLQTRAMQNYSSLYHETDRKLSIANNQLALTIAELKSTQRSYQESQKLVLGISKELEATKAILQETELMLSQAQEGRLQGQAQLASLQKSSEGEWTKTSAGLRTSIISLNEKNVQISNELNIVKQKLEFYEGNIRDNTEAKSLIKFYRSKMKLVRSKIKGFNKEAQDVKRIAQQERNRIRMILGNNGYLFKNGQDVNVDMEQYVNANLGPVKAENASQASRVEIDVTFVE